MKTKYLKFVAIIWFCSFFLGGKEGLFNFYNLRIISLIFVVPLIFFEALYLLIALGILLLNLYSFYQYDVFEQSYWYIFLSCLLINNIKNIKFNRIKYFIVVFAFVLLFILIFNFFRLGYISSNYLDPNYTGLQIIFLYYIIKNLGFKKLGLFFLIIGIFTYSRLFILSLPLVLFLDKEIFKRFRKIFNKNALKIHLLIYIIFLFVNYLILKFVFNDIQPEYVYLEKTDRLSRLVDTSNWIRIQANIVFFNTLDLKMVLLGELFGNPLVIENFENKSIYPHNLFYSLLYNSGIFFALYYLYYYCNQIRYSRFSMFIVLIFFQLILGFGPFYGHLLLILWFVNNTSFSSSKHLQDI